MRKILSLLTLITLTFIANSQSVTNKGKDFWVGYGLHQYMQASGNTQNMTLYISVEGLPAGVPYATVTITIDSSGLTPALWWKRVYRIPAYTVLSIDNSATPAFSASPASALTWGPLPKGPTDAAASNTSTNFDCRLYSDPCPAGTGSVGLFRKKGVHITSDYDVVTYAHTYGGVSSGATMLLPTNSWGYSYTTINSRQADAGGLGYNFFYVIASEDSTKIKITSSQAQRENGCTFTIATPLVPYFVNLNKGQIYQYVGQADNAGNGVDLTASKVESVANTTGAIKRIAVFAGSARTQGESDCGGGSGRDNDIQQCFPQETWGKKFVTSQFANAGSGTNLQPNQLSQGIYKVVAKDTGTTIKINGGAPISILTNSFYKFSNTTANYVEANKPIMIAQFMSGACQSGLGDPDMVYLSPLEQANNQVGFYRNTKESISANFVNIIVPDSGISSLTIDGASQPWSGNSYVYNHPNLTGYKVVVKGWAAAKAQSIVKSNAKFNAITYGLGGAESYAYNCGGYFDTNNVNLNTGCIITPTTNTNNLSGCNSVIYKTKVYTASAVVRDTVKSYQGCDSIYNVANITINNSSVSNTIVTIAITALPYTWNGINCTSTGSYTKTFVGGNSKGCDSTAILTLLIASEINTGSQWTWVSGDSIINQKGVYGTKGIAAASNKPGARYYGVSWTDASGNKWLFGGQGYAASGNGYLNDLWKYNTTTGQWTWISGDSTTNQLGVYGTKGISAASNKPGARSYSISWTDASGNLWLFGGAGYAASGGIGNLNDLWKYNTSSGQWTWVSGDNTPEQYGVYGNKGIAAASNKPGARYGSISWTDASGNLWLFGGYGSDAIGSAYSSLNDLWKYNTSSGQWTWVSGDNTVSQLSVYGTKGIAAASNKPGARQRSVSWTDASGNLWLFGGYGYVASGSVGYLNDLWKYNTSAGQWTWVSSDTTTNQKGVYGTKGIAANSNTPGARFRSISWTDASGNLWLFGGAGFDANGLYGSLNDLWKYNTSAGQWTWVSGDILVNQLGVYGTKGIAAASNKPGARWNSISWTDASGNLWLFGGFGYAASNGGYSNLNDLWKIAPICSGSITTQSVCNSYLWNGVTYTTSGVYTKTFTVAAGCDSLATLNLTIKNSTTSITNISICPNALPYSWSGLTFTTAGSKTKTGLLNSQGCDSSATLNLTVKTPTTNTVNLSGCNSVTYKTKVYTASTILRDTVKSYQGCDSIYNVTTITVNTSSIVTISSSLPITQGASLVSTLAGSGVPGNVDGLGASASFNQPSGVAVDDLGNIYVADRSNHSIRKITQNGYVITLAGGSYGNANGSGSAASFRYPSSVATDFAGNVYVADEINCLIRKITPTGVVTTLAGSGTIGSTNGTGIAASFRNPSGVITDLKGNVYVADRLNQLIRKITPAGIVTTLAGSSGNQGYLDGIGTAALFRNPTGVATDTSGNVYVADASNYLIRKITATGIVTTLAGTGNQGNTNAIGTASSFNSPNGIATDLAGNIFVADQSNHLIRKISQGLVVTTLAGIGFGNANGFGQAASFNLPNSVATDAKGNVYVADEFNHLIRKITTVIDTVKVCSGSSIILTANGGINYNWTGPQNITNNISFNALTSGVYTVTVTGVGGCISIDSIYVFVKKVTNTTVTRTQCGGSYTWNGQTYASSGIYTKTFVGGNSVGCDSIAILNLVINTITPTINSINLVACNSVFYKGKTYSTSTIVRDTVKSYQGCDSIYNVANISVRVITPTTNTTNLSGCNSVTYKTKVYTASTVVRDTVKSVQGCDSIYNVANITVRVITPTTNTTNLSGCNSVTYKTKIYTSSTVVRDTVKSYQGCDSVYNVANINIKLPTTSTTNITINATALPYLWNGLTFTSAGSQTYHTTNSQGCDSAATLNLSVRAVATIHTVFLDSVNTTCSQNTVSIPLKVKNFRNVVGLQGTIKFDTSKIQFSSYNLNSSSTLSGSNWSFNNGNANSKGEFTFIYTNVNASLTLSDSTTLFTLNFNKKSGLSVKSKTTLQFLNTPTLLSIDTATDLVGLSDLATLAPPYSIFTGGVIVNNNSNSANVITQNLFGCNSVTYKSKVYTASTLVRDTVRTIQGCDSIYNIANITVRVITPTTTTTNLSGCNSVTYKIKVYTTSTVVRDTVKSYQGCDSIYNVANITVRIIAPTTNTTNLSGCNSVTYKTKVYTASTVVRDTVKSYQGCDSMYNVANILVTPVVAITNTVNFIGCNSVTYKTKVYTSSTVVRDTIKSYQGCDSIYNVANITVRVITPTTNTTNLSGCNSVTYKTKVYTASAIVRDTVKSYQGCDSVYNVANITVRVITPNTNTINLSGCNSVTYKTKVYTASTVVRDTVKSYQGCDSIYNVANILVTPVVAITNTVNFSGCNSVTYKTKVYTSSTVVRDTIKSYQGCDSIYDVANITVRVITPTTNTTNLSGCNSVTYKTKIYTASTVVRDTVKSYQGCDSIYNVANITVRLITQTTNTTNLSGCNSVTYKTKIYTASTIVRDTVKSIQGCDSIYNVANILVTPVVATTNTQNLSGCNSVTYKTKVYSTSTIVRDTVKSYQGCDSIYNVANITVRVITPNTNTINLSGCNSVTYKTKVYTASTIVRDTVKSYQGCDSIYNVANITVRVIAPTTNTTNLSGCNNVTYKTKVYTASTVVRDTVKSIQGCDSIYNVANITVRVIAPTTNTTNLSGCNSFIYKNITYTSSAIIKDTLKTTEGCDSIYLTVNATVNPSISGRIYHPFKGNISNIKITQSGTVANTYTASGNYAAPCINATSNIVLRPTKNNDVTKANGVTSVDVLLTQRHILNTTKLNSPYKIIAADVTGDKQINSVDVLRIKRLILGTDTTFVSTLRGSRLWEFVDSAYTFPDTTNPFPFKDSISFTNLTSNKINQTFIGVKLGDVNYDWNAAIARQFTVNSLQLNYIISNKELGIGNSVVRIPITVNNFKDIIAMQYTLHINNKDYEFVGIENNKLDIDFNIKQVSNNGNISFLWTDKNADPKTLKDGAEMFTLVLRSKDDSRQSTDLTLTNDITEIEAWDKDFNQLNIILSKKETKTSNLPVITNQWSVSPNPTSGEVRITIVSKVNKTVSFELTDAQGKTIIKQAVELQKGNSNIRMNLKQNSNIAPGIYFLKAVGLDGDNVKRIIVK